MNTDVLLQVPRVNKREPFDNSRWNLYANWMNGDQAMHATLPDMDGDILLGLDPTAKTVDLAGGAVSVTASAATVTVPATFNAAVTLGDAAADALTVNATATFQAPTTVNGTFTTTAATTLGNAAGDAISIVGTSTFSAPATFNGTLTATAAAAFDSTVALGNAIGDAITINGTSTFVAPATFQGAVTLGDAAADALTVNATSEFNAAITLRSGLALKLNNAANTAVAQIATDASGNLVTGGTNGSLQINGDIGFFGTSPAAKPTVSGSRAGNAALADLLNELAALGLITNSSSA